MSNAAKGEHPPRVWVMRIRSGAMAGTSTLWDGPPSSAYKEYCELTEATHLIETARREDVAEAIVLVNQVQCLLQMFSRQPDIEKAWNLNARYLIKYFDLQTEFLNKRAAQPGAKGKEE